MRILYVAKHDNGQNDDEGAIRYALEQLGHEVVIKHERNKQGEVREASKGCDFLLFHKWADTHDIEQIRIPKVFWYFDLVNYYDTSLQRRNRQRISWMKRITPLVDLGFCTDGDWVEQDKSGKLFWLPQGADERVAGSPQDFHFENEYDTDLLFTGISRGGGHGRMSFVEEMRTRYQDKFLHVTSGVYRSELRKLIGKSRIVLAPDSPTSDRYWSIRIYTSLGFSAFLLHPACGLLGLQYDIGAELITYDSHSDLHDKISYYLRHPEERRRISAAGWIATLGRHTYRHRCKAILDKIEEKLL